MPIFKSNLPPLQIPEKVTLWDWLFDSPYSTLSKTGGSKIAGYTNAKTKEQISYTQVKELSERLSTVFSRQYGLCPGDTVTLFSGNTVWYPVAMFAALRLGGIVSGASPAYNAEEMTYVLKSTKADLILTSLECLDTAIISGQLVGLPRDRILLLEGERDGFTNVKQLLQASSTGGDSLVASWKLPAGKTNNDVCGFLGFSSGTTGLFKGVMISHQNVIAQCLQLEQVTAKDLNRVLAILPFFHITGLVHSLNFPIFYNAEVYMLPEFTMESMLDAVVEYQIPELLVVPPIVLRLVRDPIVSKYDLSHIKRFFCGAAPLSKEILGELQTMFPHTGFKQGYGMTESCSAVTLCPPSYYSYQYAHKVGVILGSTELKFIDPSGNELGVGEPGEILIRGPQVVMGYLNNPQATTETFDAAGFLHSGDQGFIDEHGLVRITDRLKEMIKVKGISVAPAELEDLLLGHPQVEDCAVLSVPDERAGERPKAFIVPKGASKQGSQELGAALISFVQQQKVRHKWIYEIEFIDEVPKGPSGKILRRALLDKQKLRDGGLIVRMEESVRARL